MKTFSLILLLIIGAVGFFFSCTKDTNFNPTEEIGVTIQAFVCDTTDLDTTITISDSLTGAVTALSVFSGQTITFLGFIKGDSVNDITWSWDFGDTATSVSRIVEHRYMKPGEYKAVFTVTNSVGVSLSDTVSISITQIPQRVAVRGYAFLQGKSKHDGIELCLSPEVGTEVIINTIENGFFYKSADILGGTYTIYYTDKNTGWFSPDTIKNVTITDGILNELGKVILKDNYNPQIENCYPTGIIDNRIPSIQASLIDTASGIAKETFLLIFNGDTIPDSLISCNDSSFSWKPSIRLPDGNCSVFASVYDSAGNSVSKTWAFTVDAMKLYAMQDTTARINDTVNMHGRISNVYSKVVEYRWDFNGDSIWDDTIGTNDTLISTPHVFTHEDTYYSVLYSRDDSGRVKYDTAKIIVTNTGAIVVVNNDTTISIKDQVLLVGSAHDTDGTIIEYAWDAEGDGDFEFVSASDSVTVHTYNTAGVFNATFRVKDDDDKVSMDTVVITVLQDAPSISFLSNDTVIERGGMVKCSVVVTQQFGTFAVEIDTNNTGNWIAIADNGFYAVKYFITDTSISWDSAKVRITDDDENVVIDGFKVDIRPRPLVITSIDSTVNTITVNFNQTQDNDFAEYRIYRNPTADVDSLDQLWASISNNTITSHTSPQSYNWVPRYYRIYQIDNEGAWSLGSNVIYGNIVNSPPQAPIVVYPLNDYDTIWSDEILKWSACLDINDHIVRYKVMINHNNTGYKELVNNIIDTTVKLTGYDSLNIVIKVMSFDMVGDTCDWFDERIACLKCANTRGMVLLNSAGTSFQMGQAGVADTVHQVNFTYDFWIDMTEVTQENYTALMGVNPSYFGGTGNLPVEQVTWFDAVLYCNARSKSLGFDTVYSYTSITGIPGDSCVLSGVSIDLAKKGYRLPTEAEWEYACRAGTTTDYYWGNGSIDSYAWYTNNCAETRAVGGKTANAYNLFDMCGNVCEWCNDWYDIYNSGNQTDPEGPLSESDRVKRGGSWDYTSLNLRSASRFFDPPDIRTYDIGFRVVLPVLP